MSGSQQAIAVLGTGSWGTALAVLLSRNGSAVRLWGRDAKAIEQLQRVRCNARYLPDVPLPAELALSSDLSFVLKDVRDVLIAVPSAAFRETLQMLERHWQADMRVAWATKGLEPGSGKLLHEALAEELPTVSAIAVVSGPSFAREVAAGLPTALTVAANDTVFAGALAGRLHNASFRAYTSDDIIGVEIGGAVKNVLAIAAGIADGLGFGANTRAALVTRGLAEMMRLGGALGGRHDTFMGLAGLGDLLLTCTDDQSRNRRLGLALGRGVALEKALSDIGQVVEGVHTAREVYELALRHGVDMPITEQVFKVLYQNTAPEQAVQNLMQREQKPENG